MKLDPYNHQKLYENWKKNPDSLHISSANNKILQKYIFDMEIGRNVSRHTKKGARSFIRLNKARQKIYFIAELLEKHQKIMDITKVTEDQIHRLFNDMRKGVIKRLDGEIYKSTGDYVKVFKAFWHWYQRVSSKPIKDITIDLDTSEELPEFVYFTEEQLNEMIKIADDDMKVLILFAYDAGLRVTEMKNIKVSDFLNDFKELNIREETAKTFGRRIKLMMCSDTIKKYVQNLELKNDDYVFQLDVNILNGRLNKLGEKVLRKPNLTLYDIRHSSACYWYPRYPNIQGLLYRFGWKDLKMAHYYARFLGMEDTVTEENLLLGVTKTEIEKRLTKTELRLKGFETLMKEYFTQAKSKMKDKNLSLRITDEEGKELTPEQLVKLIGDKGFK